MNFDITKYLQAKSRTYHSWLFVLRISCTYPIKHLAYDAHYPQPIHSFLKLQTIVIIDLYMYQNALQQQRCYNAPFGFTHATLFHADRLASY
jgi:hypothetical protein